MTSDGELRSFWECIDLRGNLWSPSETPWRYGLPTLNKESLADYLTHVAFYVTAWHEHVGSILHYLMPPLKGMGLKIRPGREEKDVQVCRRYKHSHCGEPLDPLDLRALVVHIWSQVVTTGNNS